MTASDSGQRYPREELLQKLGDLFLASRAQGEVGTSVSQEGITLTLRLPRPTEHRILAAEVASLLSRWAL